MPCIQIIVICILLEIYYKFAFFWCINKLYIYFYGTMTHEPYHKCLLSFISILVYLLNECNAQVNELPLG